MEKIRVYRYRDISGNVVVSRYLDNICKWIESSTLIDRTVNFKICIESVLITVNEYNKFPVI
jgi:hypothetical protein